MSYTTISEYRPQPGATRFEVELFFMDRDSVKMDFEREPSDALIQELINNQYAKAATVRKFEQSVKSYNNAW
jgi:hypothetical protein